MTNKIKFDGATHKYFTQGGERVLSVTSVISNIPADLMYKQAFINATHRGKRVHAACELINLYYVKTGKIKIPTKGQWKKLHLEDQDYPYVRGYLKLLERNQPTIFAVEKKVYHPGFKYAGTLDICMVLKGKAGIFDIKSSAKVAPYTVLQLSAYLEAYNKENKDNKDIPHCSKRNVIHLLPTGMYNLIQYPVSGHRTDFDIFVCMLKAAQWRAEHQPTEDF